MTPRWRRASLALVLLAISAGADESLLQTEPGPAAAAATREFEAGEETAACRAFFEQLRTGSEDPWAYRHAAICAHSVEGFEEPFDDFIAAADQDDVLALWGRAYLSFLEKDYQAAEVGARRAVDLRPRFAFAWNLLGISLEQLSRQEEAMAAIETSLKLAPDLPFPRPNLLRMVSGELEALLPALEEAREVLAVRSMPPSTSAPGERFATGPETGKLPAETSAAMAGAEELLQRLDRSLGAGQSWIQEGRLLLRLGLDTEGVAALRHAAELARAAGEPLTEADAKYEEATFLRGGGRQQAAQRLFREARRLYSADDSSHAELWEAWSAVYEAKALVALGRHRRALDLLREPKEHFHRTGNHAGGADAWFTEATAWFASGEIDREVAALEESRRLYRAAEVPAGVAVTWLRQGLAVSRGGDRAGAAGAFRQAGEIYQDLADHHAAWDAFFKEGSALSRIELHGSASLEAFRRSLQAIREDKRLARAEGDRLALARAWHREGNSLFQLEETEAALEAFRTARKLYPRDAATDERLQTWVDEGLVHLHLEAYKAALEAFDAAKRSQGADTDPVRRGNALLFRARALLGLGRLEAARTGVRRARALFEAAGNASKIAATWDDEKRIVVQIEKRDGMVYERLDALLAELVEEWPGIDEPRVAYTGAPLMALLEASASAIAEEAYVDIKRRITRLMIARPEERETLLDRWLAESIFDEIGLWQPAFLIEAELESKPVEAALALEAWMALATAAERKDLLFHTARLALEHLEQRFGPEAARKSALPWVELAEATKGLLRQRARLLTTYAEFLVALERDEAALEPYRRSEELFRSIPDARGEAASLLEEARILFRLNRLDEARAVYQRVQQLSEGNGLSSILADALLEKGQVISRLGEHHEGLISIRKARDRSEESGDRRRTAQAWQAEAQVLGRLGENRAALAAYIEAIERFRRIGDPEAEADALLEQATILVHREEYEHCLDLLRRARNTFRELELQAGEAKTWYLESLVFLNLGNLYDSREAARRSRELAKLSGDALGEGLSALAASRVLSASGDQAGGLLSVKEAKEHFRNANARGEEAMALLVEGNVLLILGRQSEARDTLNEASELAQRAGAQFTRSNALLSKAWLLLAEDDLEQAIGLALEAARYFTRAGNRPNERSALLTAAQAYSQAGDEERAVTLARQAVSLHSGIRTTRIDELHRTVSDQRVASAFAIIVPTLVSLDRTDEALEWAERARSRVLLDLLSSGDRFQGSVPEELAAESGRLRAELARNQAARRAAEHPDRRRELDTERTRLLTQLERNRYERRAAEPSELVAAEPLAAGGIHELAGQVGPILKFYTTESEVLGFLIRSDEPLRVETVEIGQTELQERIQSFARDLANPLFADRAATVAAELWDRLVEPFVADLPAGGPLTLVPHGPLHQLPFGALRDREGRRLFTLWDLSVTPSASTLAVARGRHRPPSQDETFVAFASGRGLPLTAHEANLIAGHFGDDSRVFTPTEARFERYENFARHARQLLVTTRGGFEEFSIHGTYLEILPTPGVHDSRLSAAEIAAIPLDAELVVLAACDTARGRALLSDERLDLTRAFLAAGAVAVLATRWKVPESPATTRFLVDFYSAYRTGGPGGGPIRKDEALSAARRAAVARGDAAAIWAAWVLVGDAR